MVDNLIRLISDIVDKKLREHERGKPKMWSAKVVASSGSVLQDSIASVYINGDQTSTPINVKNKSNQTLLANNEVYLISPSGSLGDAVVLFKK